MCRCKELSAVPLSEQSDFRQQRRAKFLQFVTMVGPKTASISSAKVKNFYTFGQVRENFLTSLVDTPVCAKFHNQRTCRMEKWMQEVASRDFKTKSDIYSSAQ